MLIRMICIIYELPGLSEGRAGSRGPGLKAAKVIAQEEGTLWASAENPSGISDGRAGGLANYGSS